MNREKLQQLSDALHNTTVLPDFDFHMSKYGTCSDLDYCVCGFANAAGISSDNEIQDILNDGDERRWVVSGYWAEVDNTREGAALRIDYLIDTGLPENWCEQINGTAPLTYK